MFSSNNNVSISLTSSKSIFSSIFSITFLFISSIITDSDILFLNCTLPFLLYNNTFINISSSMYFLKFSLFFLLSLNVFSLSFFTFSKKDSAVIPEVWIFFCFFSTSNFIASSDIPYFRDISFICISLSATFVILLTSSITSSTNFTLSETFSKLYFFSIFSNLNSNNDILFFTCFKKLSFPYLIIYSSGSFAPSYFTTLTSAPKPI